MALESATYLDDLVTTNPTVTDQGKTLADHVWLLKTVLQTTFPNIDAAVTGTPAELNYLAGVTPGTSASSKCLVLDSSSNLTSGNMNNMALGGLIASGTVSAGTVLCTGTVTGGTVTDGTASLNGGTLSSASLTSPVLNTGVSGTAVDTDSTMAADSDTKVASQKAIAAHVASAIAGVSSGGKVLDIAFDTNFSDVDLTTSWLTRGEVTLSNVQSGSSVLLLSMGVYYGITGADDVLTTITDSANTSLYANSEQSRGYVNNLQYITLMGMAQDASPGTGSQTFRARHQCGSGDARMMYGAFLALEIGA